MDGLGLSGTARISRCVYQNVILTERGKPFNERDLDAKMEMHRRRERCAECFDTAFSGVWSPKLRGPNKRRAHSFLRRAVPFFPVCSVKDEHKHTLGQELMKHKRRGRAFGATRLSTATYRKHVRLGMLRQWATAKKSIMGNIRGKDITDAILSLSSVRPHRLAREGARRPVIKSRTTKNTSGHAQYKRSEWPQGVRPASEAGREATAAINTRWRAMPPAARAVYETQASGQNARDSEIVARGPGEGLPPGASRSARHRLKRSQVLRAMDRLQQHQTWFAGSQMSQWGRGLKPEAVDVVSTSAQISKVLEDRFGFKCEPCVNGVSVAAEKTCELKYGGVCSKDPYLEQTMAMMYNLYVVFSKASIKQDSLPLCAMLSSPTKSFITMIAFKFGKGDFFGCARIVALDDAGCFKLDYRDVEVGGESKKCIICVPLHRMAMRMLEEAGAAKDLLNSIKYVIYDIARVPGDEFMFRAIEKQRGELATNERAQCRRKKVEVWMPFGMTAVGEHDSKKEKGDELGGGTSDGSDPELRDGVGGDEPVSSESADSASSEGDRCPDGVVVADGEGDDDVIPPVPDPEEVVVKPRTGIMSFGSAPTNRTKCYVCMGPIRLDGWRFEYRMKPTNSFRDIKWVHGDLACIARLPSDNREHDRSRIDELLEEGEGVLPPLALALLVEARRTLEGSASSSGAALG